MPQEQPRPGRDRCLRDGDTPPPAHAAPTGAAAGPDELLRTRFSYDHAPDPIYWIGPDASILHVNDAACALTGYARDALLSMRVFDLDPELDPDAWPQHWESTRDGRTRVVETRHRRKDGTTFPVEVAITFLAYQGQEYHCAFARDVSERRAVDDALRDGEQRLRLALMVAQQAMFDLDLATGESRVSPEYASMLGYDPVGFRETNQGWLERLHPDDRQRVEAMFRAYVAGETPEYEAEYRQRTRDGGWKWILSVGRIVERDGDGRPARMIGTHTDIAERKHHEHERELLQAQFLHAQKLESVGLLAGGVAHDFNNMLCVIQGYAELIAGRLGAEDPLSEDVGEILRAAERAREMAQQLLSFSRKQAADRRPASLNTLIGAMLKSLARLVGEDLELVWDPQMSLGEAHLDPSQMEQLLLNLVVNARDAMPHGGRLKIETSNVSVRHATDVRDLGVEPGEYVCLRVADDGVGMDPSTLERVFEPFFTTKESGRGTGLGLATVYGIVKSHDGAVHVDSAPGRGTTFSVYLPRSRDGAEEPEERTARPGVAASGTILLVEDDEIVSRTTRRMLETIGYRVLVAHSPDEAVAICRDDGEEIDMLLTDIVLPGMNGRDLHEVVRDILPGIATLFMSGYTGEDIDQRGRGLRKVAPFLQKPFTLQDLESKLAETRAKTRHATG
jgi:PAS domain S-box-containing protein